MTLAHPRLSTPVVCAFVVCMAVSCESVGAGTREFKDFWESEEGEWAREFAVNILDSEAPSGEDVQEVASVSFLSEHVVTASSDGDTSSTTGGMAPRSLAVQEGQIQSFDIGPQLPSGSQFLVYSVFTLDEEGDPNGTEIWTLNVAVEGARPSKINLAGPNFRMNPVYGDDGKIYFTTDEFGGLVLARMSENGRGFQRLGLEGGAFPADVHQETILYNAALNSGHSEIRLVEASSGFERTTTIGEGVQPQRLSAEDPTVFFVRDGSIWKTQIGNNTIQERVIQAPAPQAGETLQPVLKDPAISPSGELLAYASNETKIGDRFNYEIWVAGIDGSNAECVTKIAAKDDMPQWLDDDTLVFRSNRGLKWGLWEIRISRDERIPDEQ